MRHNRDDKRFNRDSGHLRCMLANMTSDLIVNGRIKTTLPKAKELRRYAERMITLGKAGNLSARRRAMAFMRNKVAVTRLFTDIAPGYKDRNGGYTRILKLGVRPGDCAPMSMIELVEGSAKAPEAKAKKAEPAEKKAAAKKPAEKKALARKPAVKKAAAKKPAKKKATTKKTATGKPAKKKTKK
jgi:large subunit ribosomal protein L17